MKVEKFKVLLYLKKSEPDKNGKSRKAVEVLRAENFAVMLTDVVCISCPNVAGSLAKVLDYLAAENIFIEYMYAFAQGDTAHVVIRPSNVERCMEILNKLNCNVLTLNSATLL